MQKSATGTFLKFSFGFVAFLVLSFCLTLAASHYSQAQNQQQAAAAAISLMLK